MESKGLRFKNKEDEIINIIFGENKKDKENIIECLIELNDKINYLGNKINQDLQYQGKNTKKNIYEKLIEEMSSVESISIHESKTFGDETKVLTSLKTLFEKLDSSGQKLASINKISKYQKKDFLIVKDF